MNSQTLETRPDQNRTETSTIRSDFAVPTVLESTGTKLVYLYLDATNGGDIDSLRDSLDMKTITLYPILQTLQKHGLVERDGETYHVSA